MLTLLLFDCRSSSYLPHLLFLSRFFLFHSLRLLFFSCCSFFVWLDLLFLDSVCPFQLSLLSPWILSPLFKPFCWFLFTSSCLSGLPPPHLLLLPIWFRSPLILSSFFYPSSFISLPAPPFFLLIFTNILALFFSSKDSAIALYFCLTDLIMLSIKDS